MTTSRMLGSARAVASAILVAASGVVGLVSETRLSGRRLLAIVAVVLLVFAPMGVVANAPERFSEETTSISCRLVVPDGSSALLRIQVSKEYGGGAALEFDEPTIVSGESEVELSSDGTVLDAAIQLWTLDETMEPPFGAFVGTATVSALLTPIQSSLSSTEFKYQSGNRVLSWEDSSLSLSVEGEVILPDQTQLQLNDCFVAWRLTSTFFGTNPAEDPASFIAAARRTILACHWETADGSVDLRATGYQAVGGQMITGNRAIGQPAATASIFLDLERNDFAVAWQEGGTINVRGNAIEYSSAHSLWTDWDEAFEYLFEGTGIPDGTATASALLTPWAVVRFVESIESLRQTFHGKILSVEGRLEIDLNGSLSLVMDDESCVAFLGRTMQHWVDPGGH